MIKSKITRRALALRLFALVALINLLMLIFVWPTNAPVVTAAPPPPLHVEMKLKGVLHTPFAEGKRVLLIPPTGISIGEGLLKRQEEDGLVLWLPEQIYRKHHRSLVQHEWALLPHVEGLTRPLSYTGENYEIAY